MTGEEVIWWVVAAMGLVSNTLHVKWSLHEVDALILDILGA